RDLAAALEEEHDALGVALHAAELAIGLEPERAVVVTHLGDRELDPLELEQLLDGVEILARLLPGELGRAAEAPLLVGDLPVEPAQQAGAALGCDLTDAPRDPWCDLRERDAIDRPLGPILRAHHGQRIII